MWTRVHMEASPYRLVRTRPTPAPPYDVELVSLSPNDIKIRWDCISNVIGDFLLNIVAQTQPFLKRRLTRVYAAKATIPRLMRRTTSTP